MRGRRRLAHSSTCCAAAGIVGTSSSCQQHQQHTACAAARSARRACCCAERHDSDSLSSSPAHPWCAPVGSLLLLLQLPLWPCTWRAPQDPVQQPAAQTHAHKSVRKTICKQHHQHVWALQARCGARHSCSRLPTKVRCWWETKRNVTKLPPTQRVLRHNFGDWGLHCLPASTLALFNCLCKL